MHWKSETQLPDDTESAVDGDGNVWVFFTSGQKGKMSFTSARSLAEWILGLPEPSQEVSE